MKAVHWELDLKAVMQSVALWRLIEFPLHTVSMITIQTCPASHSLCGFCIKTVRHQYANKIRNEIAVVKIIPYEYFD